MDGQGPGDGAKEAVWEGREQAPGLVCVDSSPGPPLSRCEDLTGLTFLPEPSLLVRRE